MEVDRYLKDHLEPSERQVIGDVNPWETVWTPRKTKAIIFCQHHKFHPQRELLTCIVSAKVDLKPSSKQQKQLFSVALQFVNRRLFNPEPNKKNVHHQTQWRQQLLFTNSLCGHQSQFRISEETVVDLYRYHQCLRQPAEKTRTLCQCVWKYGQFGYLGWEWRGFKGSWQKENDTVDACVWGRDYS